jgi:hypothetical protein
MAIYPSPLLSYYRINQTEKRPFFFLTFGQLFYSTFPSSISSFLFKKWLIYLLFIIGYIILPLQDKFLLADFTQINFAFMKKSSLKLASNFFPFFTSG